VRERWQRQELQEQQQQSRCSWTVSVASRDRGACAQEAEAALQRCIAVCEAEPAWQAALSVELSQVAALKQV
jgi:hypothetical protein